MRETLALRADPEARRALKRAREDFGLPPGGPGRAVKRSHAGGHVRGATTECPGCCDDEPPPAVGACCVGEACQIRSLAECNILSGLYLGDGTTCAGNPCATSQPLCCAQGATCWNRCGQQGGVDLSITVDVTFTGAVCGAGNQVMQCPACTGMITGMQHYGVTCSGNETGRCYTVNVEAAQDISCLPFLQCWNGAPGGGGMFLSGSAGFESDGRVFIFVGSGIGLNGSRILLDRCANASATITVPGPEFLCGSTLYERSRAVYTVTASVVGRTRCTSAATSDGSGHIGAVGARQASGCSGCTSGNETHGGMTV